MKLYVKGSTLQDMRNKIYNDLMKRGCKDIQENKTKYNGDYLVFDYTDENGKSCTEKFMLDYDESFDSEGRQKKNYTGKYVTSSKNNDTDYVRCSINNIGILKQVEYDAKNFLKQARNPKFKDYLVDVFNVRMNTDYSKYTIDELVDMINSGEEEVEDCAYFDFTYIYQLTGISVDCQENYMILDGEFIPYFEEYDDTDMAQEIVQELLGEE